MAYSSTLWVAVATSLMGAFQYGYLMGVLNTVLEVVAVDLSFDPVIGGGIVVSSALLGAAVGAMISGSIADKVGLKFTQIVNSLVLVFGAILCAATTDSRVFGLPWVLLLGRMIQGFAAGACTLLTPRYVAEISPAALRGRLGAGNQIMINVGILCSYLIALPYQFEVQAVEIFGAKVLWWRVMLAFAGVFAVIQFCLLHLVPESPVWLDWQQKPVEAARSRLALWGKQKEETERLLDTGHEPKALEEGTIEKASGGGKAEGFSALFRKRYRLMVILGIGILMYQQLSGVNTVVMYSSTVFKSAGVENPILSSIYIGVANLCVTVISSPFLDMYGRKPMMLWSHGGMAIWLLGLSLATSAFVSDSFTKVLSLPFVLLYMVFFAIGSGPVPWIYISEILPEEVKGAIGGTATGLCWIFNLFISLTFPTMLQLFHLSGSYLIYGLLNFTGVLFVYFLMVETKQQDLHSISKRLMLED